jgi:hypothetical protein
MVARALLGIAIVLIVAVALVAIFARSRQETAALVSPTPTPSQPVTASPSPTVTPSASPTPSATASPSATITGDPYVNTTWQYSLVLPPPYRHSDVLSFKSPPPTSGEPRGSDGFTARTPQDEASVNRSCETACEIWNYAAEVEIWTNAPSMSAREWADDPNRAGWFSGQRVEDFTLNGRPAARIINGARGPLTYVVANAGRMYVMSYRIYEVLPYRRAPRRTSSRRS